MIVQKQRYNPTTRMTADTWFRVYHCIRFITARLHSSIKALFELPLEEIGKVVKVHNNRHTIDRTRYL